MHVDTNMSTCMPTHIICATHMSIHMSIHMSTRMSIHMSAHMSSHMSSHMSAHMSAHVSVHMSAHMSVHMYVHCSRELVVLTVCNHYILKKLLIVAVRTWRVMGAAA